MPKVSQAHLDSRRSQILAAATRCFARQGFHRTTMQDIVKQSKLSPGAIYNYFDGKQAIIEALAKERHASEQAFLRSAQQHASVADALRSIRDAFFRKLDDPEERRLRRVSIQLWAEAQRNPRIKELVRRGIDRPRELLARLVRDGQARGEISADLDAEAAARLMIAVFHGFVLQLDSDNHAEVEPYIAVLDSLLGRLLA